LEAGVPMKIRNPLTLIVFHWFFVFFMLAPLLMVVLVSFTNKGYISMPFDGIEPYSTLRTSSMPSGAA
jgi:ABC-type spermidine/putrescine transport system permease subunit II